MKRRFAFLLCLMLALVGCGAKKNVPAEPPELTVTNAQGARITAMGGSYDWDYDAGGGQRTGVVACGMHPLDEVLRDSTPALEMPVALSASSHYTVTLDFGKYAPDSVAVRFWNEQCWGDTEAKAETMAAERLDDGTYRIELIPSIGIFAVDASWDAKDYRGTACYTFCTKAAGEALLHAGAVLSLVESEEIRKLDISWLSGGVSVQAVGQTSQITVQEDATTALTEEEKLVCAVDGGTLRIRFMSDARRDSFEGEKFLTVSLPWELVKNAHFEEIDIETTSAYAYVSADAQKIELSTLSGDARVMCANCPEVEIETVSGNVGVVDGTWARVDISTLSGAIELAGDAESAEIETTSGKVDIAGALGALDFESVSGDLTLSSERALRLDAETTSGAVRLYLPELNGFDLDFSTTSGALETDLTGREGTMIACGDRFTRYSVPALDGGETSELAVKTVSGGLQIEAVSGSN
mgnify:FL=1